MTDHDTTIREAVQYRDALTSDEVITVQIKSTAKPLVPVDPDKLSGMLEALLAVIEQQQNATSTAQMWAAWFAAELDYCRAEVERLRDVMDGLTDVLYVPTDEIVDAVRRRAKEYAAARLAESERDAALAKLDAVRAWTQNGEAYIRGGQRKELFRILDGEGA